MTTSTINVRVNSQLKDEADSLFSDLGLNMSSAITLFLKAAVRDDGIPFAITREKPNATTLAALAEAKDMRTDKAAYPRYHSTEQMFKDILG